MSIITSALKKAQKNRSEEPDVHRVEPSVGYLSAGSILETEQGVKKDSGKMSKKNVFPRILFFIVFTGILLPVAFFGYNYFFGRTGTFDNNISSPALKAGHSPLSVQSSIKEPSANAIDRAPAPEFRGTQPAKQLSAVKSGKDLPELNGIMYSSVNPQVILNGIVVFEGEKLGLYTVMKISPDRVKLSSGDEEFELKLR